MGAEGDARGTALARLDVASGGVEGEHLGEGETRRREGREKGKGKEKKRESEGGGSLYKIMKKEHHQNNKMDIRNWTCTT